MPKFTNFPANFMRFSWVLFVFLYADSLCGPDTQLSIHLLMNILVHGLFCSKHSRKFGYLCERVLWLYPRHRILSHIVITFIYLFVIFEAVSQCVAQLSWNQIFWVLSPESRLCLYTWHILVLKVVSIRKSFNSLDCFSIRLCFADTDGTKNQAVDQ